MPLNPIPELRSQRLLLRPVAAADLEDLQAMNGDDAVTRFLPYASWTGPADGQAWLARMQGIVASGTARQLVLQRLDDGRVIGTALLFRHDEANARVEVGYALGRAHWRQGLMREALERLCGHAFESLGIRRIEAEVNPANEASGLLLQSLGFTLEGRLRERWTAKGQTYDSHFYGCLAREWAARRPVR